MARPRKYSTDTLLLIIREYLTNNEYITKLSYANLSKYAKEIGYENIDWQDFGRNKEIKAFVEEYNKQKKLTMYTKLNSDKLDKLSFDVETIVEKNIKDKKQLKLVLKIFKEGYDRAFEKLIKNEEIIKEYKSKIDEQNQIINKLNEKNKKIRNELREIKENNKANKATERDKYMYALLKYVIDTKNIPINTTEEIMNLLKNFISDKSSDIENPLEILEENFIVKENLIENDKIKTQKQNIMSLEGKKLKIPNFIKNNKE